MRRLLYVLIGTFLFMAGEVQAQVDRATLTGTVKDSSGAVVPGATVTITGPQAPSVTTTNGEGTYLVLSLIPGRYVVSAELSGFMVSWPLLRFAERKSGPFFSFAMPAASM